MAQLVRTILRHQTVLLRTQFRPISVCSVQFNQENRKKNDSASSITTSSATDNADISTDVRPIGERIKENTKTASYLGVIVVGVAVTGVLIFAVCRELWSSSSSNSVYSAALKACIDDPRVQDSLGSPIKGYGEESRRRRRQHVAHTVVARNDEPFMKMHFYIQGIRNKATVQLEKRLVRTPFTFQHCASDLFSRIFFQLFITNDLTLQSDGKYRYFFVQLDHFPNTTIIIEDNRLIMDEPEYTNINWHSQNWNWQFSNGLVKICSICYIVIAFFQIIFFLK